MRARTRHCPGWLALILLVPGLACSGASSNPTGGSATPGAGTASVNPDGTPAGGNTVASGGNGSTMMTGGGGDGTVPIVPDINAAAADCAASNMKLNAGLTPARRLTRTEYNNTVRDLLGATGTPADGVGDDEQIGPFYSNAIAPVDEGQVQKYSEVAATLAVAAKARMSTLSPCDLKADTTTACATKFVTALGQKAYRRPLTTDEIGKYVNLYSVGQKATEGAPNGFRLVVEAMLQSPYFLYHHDVGGTGAVQGGTVAVTAWEMASRLSYFLWNSMPDDTLFGLAANGTLTDDATLSAQVTRLIADPRAATTIAMFHQQWLGFGDLADQSKDGTLYPKYNAALADAMLQETALFTDSVVRQGDGLLKTLLTSNLAFPQGDLFGVYGVTQPAGFKAGTPVPLDATKRAGILTQAAFLTRWGHADQTSPVHRGKLIRLNVMCGTVQPPPPNVNTTPPPASPATSTRERFAQHSTDPVCAGCHQLMDPIGLGFENYDSIGAYRTVDGLGPVDATGNISQVSADLAGNFNGAIELANKLANSKDVEHCFANQWFRFSLGRMESKNDACSIQSIRDGFDMSGGNIRELLAKVAMSPAFRNVRLTPDG